MESKIKISEIIRYILLGGVICAIIVFFLFFAKKTGTLKFDEPELESLVTGTSETLLLIGFLAIFYVIGVFAQGFKSSLYFFGKMHFGQWFFRDNFIARLFRILFASSFFYNYKVYCRVLKEKNRDTGVGNWIYISDRPDDIVEVIEKIVERKKSDVIENDAKYLNDFLIALLVPLKLLALAVLVIVFSFDASASELGSWEFGPWYFCPREVLMLIFTGICILVALVIWFAKSYAIEYIKNLNSSVKAEEIENIDALNKAYNLKGSPAAYVLIRFHFKKKDNRYDDFKQECIDNLERALTHVQSQTYYNLNVILLEDTGDAGADYPKDVVKEIVRKHREKDVPGRKIKINHIMANCGGPAKAAYKIKQAFLSVARDNDICVMLDDDDYFCRDTAVEDIVARMNRDNSRICITEFETEDSIDISILNKGGQSHNELVQKLNTRSRYFSEEFCYLSSLGWTKSYTKAALTCYFETVKNFEDLFCGLNSYEDFPDILALLYKDTKITGVTEPTHAYVKYRGSITGTPNARAFRKYRTGFLQLLVKMTFAAIGNGDSKSLLIRNADRYMAKFLIFKICQIENILAKYMLKGREISKNERPTYMNEFAELHEYQFCKWFCEEQDILTSEERIRLKELIAGIYGLETSDETLFGVMVKAVDAEIESEQNGGKDTGRLKSVVDAGDFLTCKRENYFRKD